MKNSKKALKFVEDIEKKLFILSKTPSFKVYRNINDYQWIENRIWPIGAYRILKKVSIGNVFPASFSLWWNNLKFHFNYQIIHRRGYKNLIGYLVLYPFTKKNSYALLAQIIFFKRGGKYVVLFYLENEGFPSIFKVNIRYKNFENEITQEIESQRIANSIQCSKVGTPKLKSFRLNEDIQYLEQELVLNCKSLKYIGLKQKHRILDQVFDFLFKFYKKNGLSSIYAITSTIDFNMVREALIFHLGDDSILNKMNIILKLKKKMIFGRVHGDLCYNNIIVSPEKIFIIDWGLSGEKYLCEDLIHKLMIIPNSIKSNLMKNVIDYFNFNVNELYSLEQQQFLTVCLRMFNRITIEKNRFNKSLGEYIKTEKNVLIANKLI